MIQLQFYARNKYCRRVGPKDFRSAESVEGAFMAVGMALERDQEKLVEIWREKKSLQELKEGKLSGECQKLRVSGQRRY